MAELLEHNMQEPASYTADDVKTLDWREHIRRRPGMYIGKLGDGSHADDGIYVILKEVLDNAIDEYAMGFGRQIKVDIADNGTVEVRDYGRGIPLETVLVASSKMNTSAKFDSRAFKKSVGLNGVGIKATNALSSYFEVTAYRDNQSRTVKYVRGEVVEDNGIFPSDEESGTYVKFIPDNEIFKDFKYKDEYVEALLKN